MARGWRGAATVLVALAPVAVGLTSCDDGPASGSGDPTSVGDVVDGRHDLTDEQEYTVWLPVGETTLEVARLRDHLDAGATDAGRALDAPSGTSFLGVGWTRTDTYVDRDLEEMVTGTDDPAQQDPARLWVVADGKRHEVPDVGTLGGPSGRDSPVYVVVPDDAELSLEVEHSGLTQTVDLVEAQVEPGRAAELAGLTEQTGVGLDFVDCSRGLTGLAADLATCSVDGRWSTPYLHDRGWARPGTTWVVVHAGLMIGQPGIVGTDLDARLDGRDPVDAEVGQSREIGTDKRFVFEVPTRSARVLELSAHLERDRGPDLVGTGRTSLLDD